MRASPVRALADNDHTRPIPGSPGATEEITRVCASRNELHHTGSLLILTRLQVLHFEHFEAPPDIDVWSCPVPYAKVSALLRHRDSICEFPLIKRCD